MHNMTSSKIELGYHKTARIADAADLAEAIFPGNRNQQYTFLVLWMRLKWAPDSIVSDLARVAHNHGITRRTYERVRSRMRRLGLIDRVSRFNRRHGRREGWMLSSRFERSLTQLADKVSGFRATATASRDKDTMLVHLAAARREAKRHADQDPDINGATENRGDEK